MTASMASLDLNQEIEQCSQCPRLRNYCLEISRKKRKAYRLDSYWGKPVAGFGDPSAKLFIVGLAPGAHGANRTGRVFTGDQSGFWLYRALYRSGFSNQPNSTDLGDGLELKNAYVTCTVKCAPPDNKPAVEEKRNCEDYFKSELKSIQTASVYIALGKIAYDALWKHLKTAPLKKPVFRHGAEIDLPRGKHLILSYHPSQQNTFTGRLSENQFDQIFTQANQLLGTFP